jgi:predicted nucleic acid-binding Zn ribbon protein
MGEVLSQLLARRGFARLESGARLEQAWQAAAGSVISARSRVGGIRRGVLQVLVADSVLVQELTFRKQELVERLRQQLPDDHIRDLRFRVGALA